MGKRLYVGNLSYAVDSAGLQDLFSQYGRVVDAAVVKHRDTGRSKGFGFVEMETDSEAAAAIEALNNAEHDGRPLSVNEARPKEEGGGGGRRY